MFFGLHGDVVTDEDAGLFTGNGNDAWCSKNFCFTISYQGIEFGVEAEGITMPEFKVTSELLFVVITVTIAVRSLSFTLGNVIPAPVYA